MVQLAAVRTANEVQTQFLPGLWRTRPNHAIGRALDRSILLSAGPFSFSLVLAWTCLSERFCGPSEKCGGVRPGAPPHAPERETRVFLPSRNERKQKKGDPATNARGGKASHACQEPAPLEEEREKEMNHRCSQRRHRSRSLVRARLVQKNLCSHKHHFHSV